jgi:hypothetical protein
VESSYYLSPCTREGLLDQLSHVHQNIQFLLRCLPPRVLIFTGDMMTLLVVNHSVNSPCKLLPEFLASATIHPIGKPYFPP